MKSLAFTLFLFFVSHIFWGQTPIQLNDVNKNMSLGKDILLFKDVEGRMNMSIEEVSTLKFGTNKNKIVNLGYNTDIDWLHFKIQNSTSNSVYCNLNISKVLLDTIDLYYQIDGQWIHTQTGAAFPDAARKVNSQGFYFPIDFPANTTVPFYIRVVSVYTKTLDIQLKDNAKIHHDNVLKSVTQAFYVGAILMIGLYNLFLWFSFRDKLYLIYFCLNIFTLLIIFTMTGTYVLVFNEKLRYFIPHFSMFSNSFYVLFASVFNLKILDLKKYSYSGYITMLSSIGISLITLVAFLIMFSYSFITVKYGALLMMSFTIIALIVGIIAMKKSSPFAKYYLLGWTALLLGTFCMALKVLGVIPANIVTGNLYLIGSILEMLLFSFALAERYNMIQKERNQLEEQLKHRENDLAMVISDNKLRYQFKQKIYDEMVMLQKFSGNILQSKLNSYINELSLQLVSETKQNIIQDNIETISMEFEEKLTSEYPKLTKNEREFCQLVYLNLSGKEIARLRNTSESAIRSMRYRIKKKLELSTEESLEEHLKTINL